MTGRIAGVDLGEKRLGFALSDPDQFLATAKEVIVLDDANQATNVIEAFCRQHQVVRLVIGLPINMDGSRGPAAKKVEEVAERLRKRLEIPVDYWDERLTTKAAHGFLIEAGTRREKRRDLVDKVAAQLILQGYLDSRGSPLT